MLDNLRPALIITRRELRDQLRDWRIIFPVMILTLFFPFLANFTTQRVLGFVEKYGASILAVRFIPFLLMIVGFFPITISLVIALESFAGETERRSIGLC
jgi:ABC-type transport system involved in multi-copper enzyme maturation permease subunit